MQRHEAQLLKGELEKGREKIEASLKQSPDSKIVSNSKIGRLEPSEGYIPINSINQLLDAFLRKYLLNECLSLHDCKSVKSIIHPSLFAGKNENFSKTKFFDDLFLTI